MRLFFTILLWVGLSSCFSSTQPKKGPVIHYDHNIIEAGDIKSRGKYNGRIVLRNKGDKPLTIGKISPDCSCTVPELKKAEVAPGDSTFLDFVLAPKTDGHVQQTIYVENNSVNESRILFIVRGRIVD